MDFSEAAAWLLSFANFEVTPLDAAPAAKLARQPNSTVTRAALWSQATNTNRSGPSTASPCGWSQPGSATLRTIVIAAGSTTAKSLSACTATSIRSLSGS